MGCEAGLGPASWETSCSRRSVGLTCGIDFAFGALDGFGDAGFVEGFEDVVDGVDVEGLDGVLVESGGKDDVRNFEFAFDKFLEDAEAV